MIVNVNRNYKFNRKDFSAGIGCSKINVEAKRIPFLLSIFKYFSLFLEAELIEGDDIYLENTKAKIIRGKVVEIGAECEIDIIEYLENLLVANDSSVKTQENVD